MKKFSFLKKSSWRTLAGISVFVTVIAAGSVAYATHSWGNYHWARTANPFTLKLGDNVSTAWDAYLAGASSDWSRSNVLDTTVVAGNNINPKSCKPTIGRVEVCSAKYGFNGWLGVAQIWANGNHITQGITKLNDSYFTTATYNTPPWRRLVACQEIGHNFGLGHQDENFSNPNLGTCMDYTNDPDGTLKGQLSNEHPNAHDYEELGIIYQHLDGSTTISAGAPSGSGKSGLVITDASEPSAWGTALRNDSNGRPSLYGRDLGNGQKLFTFVLWANGR